MAIMMTKSTKKIAKKLNKSNKKGKLTKKSCDKFRDIQARKCEVSRKRARNIEEDWISNRLMKKADDEDDDNLPLDMLDVDLEWSKTGFAAKKRRYDDGTNEFAPRTFGNGVDLQHLLPIKLAGGEIVPKSRVKEGFEEETLEEFSIIDELDDGNNDQNYEHLSISELCAKRRQLLDDYKGRIAILAHKLMTEPQQNVHKLRELHSYASGKDVEILVSESVQKLATVSMATVFLDIIPGYRIRQIADEEATQKLKKETKHLQEFELSLIRNYQKYLQHLENCCKIFTKHHKTSDQFSTIFPYKLGILAVNCLCKLLINRSNFNFRTNVLTVIIGLAACGVEEVSLKGCECVEMIFKEDLIGELSLEAVRIIAQMIQHRKSSVLAAPRLLGCFWFLRIRQIDDGTQVKQRESLIKRKFQLKNERKSKKEHKYDKQLKKLEQELKETEAVESRSTKLKLHTLTMRLVFSSYFRIIRRSPKSPLLSVVLEGLSKFAHLINIDFFDDLISSMHFLIENESLRPLDSLHCIHTVFVILSGQGQLLNIDPCRFYRSIYELMPRIAVENDPEMQRKQTILLLKTLDMMLNSRRKQISADRTAAFVKRMALISTITGTHLLPAFLAAIRTYFLSHPRMDAMLLNEEPRSGVYLCQINDPDHCNAKNATIIPELDLFLTFPNKTVNRLVSNIRHDLIGGKHRILPQISTKKPWELIELENCDSMIKLTDIPKIDKKKKPNEHVCCKIEKWLNG